MISRMFKIDGGLRVKQHKMKDNPITNRNKWCFFNPCRWTVTFWSGCKMGTGQANPMEAWAMLQTWKCNHWGRYSTWDGETRTAQNISIVTTSSDTADSQQQPVPGSDWLGHRTLCALTTNYLVTKPWAYFYYSARSLLPKFDELSVTVNTLKTHIICIVESWLSSEQWLWNPYPRLSTVSFW